MGITSLKQVEGKKVLESIQLFDFRNPFFNLRKPILLSEISTRLHEEEWSKDFLRSTNARDEINESYFTKHTNGKLQEQMLGNEWATEYLQNFPLVEGKLHLSQGNGGKVDFERGMANYMLYN